MKYKQCEFCKTVFVVKSNTPRQKFCSPACGYKNRSKRPKPYTITDLCKCGCGTEILNPDNHYRYRKFIAEHRNSGGTHPRLGYTESEEHIRKRIKSVHRHFREKKPTCIEAELYNYLSKSGVVFEKQKQIGRYIPDAYIASAKLCIFADGLYWHSKPDAIERDKRCNEYLTSIGYSVVRLPSKDNGYKLDLTKLIEVMA